MSATSNEEFGDVYLHFVVFDTSNTILSTFDCFPCGGRPPEADARDFLPLLRDLRGITKPSVVDLLTCHVDTSTTDPSSLDCLPCGGPRPETLTLAAPLFIYDAVSAVDEHRQPQPP